MDPSTGMMGLGAQGNMVFTVVKPVMGIFQVSSEQGSNVSQSSMGLQSLSENTIVLPPAHSSLDQNQLEMQSIQTHNEPQIQVSVPVLTEDPSQSQELAQNAGPNAQPNSQVPFAEVSSLLDPNMKGSKADTRTLCEDMKDFAHDYIDYGNMAKQLIPETNTVQHWSKLIETRNHLEDMRKCFKDPVNSGAFENVTHGLGLGMLDVALDMIVMVIDQQIRILSGAAASDPADSAPPLRRIRRRHRKICSSEKAHTASGGTRDQGKNAAKAKGRVRARKKIKQDSGLSGPSETQAGQAKPDPVESNVLTFVSVGYETVGGGL
uniref:Si:ch73-127m5.2 n=1 Tax=Oryzias latipes TaxID=8090 RepID=A0A3P9H1M6_ORYLA